MFNNLIESTSHAKEFKRRGSFLLFTSATYVVLFVITGVISIYAYEARLEEQTLEIVTLLPPQEIVPDRQPEPAERPNRPRETSNTSRVPERAIPMLGVDHPEIVPEKVSAAPNKNLPLPPGGAIITGRDFNPESIAGPGSQSVGGREGFQPRQVVTISDPPPPPPDPPKPPKIVSKGVINGNAISLPRPVYPEVAKKIHVQGTVSVQVLVDLDGRVVSAKAVNGHPFLIPAAVKAALQARFSPTLLSDQPVKVSGVITYNFVLSN
ncbi:MAG TPA: TonB family protein [Pyrinomonadaceae bacterium]|nr:TonB family protein [Pyrinomonadaceae bacterium]